MKNYLEVKNQSQKQKKIKIKNKKVDFTIKPHQEEKVY